ncbi:MAG: ribosome biogenesis GTPase Der [Burkholderiaceae bacterium]
MQALPVIALIGRPNVGKSTLFNRLTRTRDALVADLPGLTRDRQYGRGRVGAIPYIVVDTGGFEPESKTGIPSLMARQTRQAVVEADRLLFLVDGRDGLTPHDESIVAELRQHSAKTLLVVNKTEGMPSAQVMAEFYKLGLGQPYAISSAHGDGVNGMIEHALEAFLDVRPEQADEAEPAWEPAPTAAEVAAAGKPSGPRAPYGQKPDGAIRIAVIGRPNAGKSTLINAFLGEERLVAFDQPGTTRDSIAVDFEREGRPYQLIDTAGVRRRARVSEAIEKFSVIKTLQAIEASNVCILLLDASEGISEQDAHLAGHILEAGRAMVVAVNKWESVSREDRDWLKQEVDRKFHFLAFARYHFISALRGDGLGALLRSADDAYAAAFTKLSDAAPDPVLHAAVTRQEPPRKGPIRPKLRYAHQGPESTLIIVIHGSALQNVSDSYKRYLEGVFRREFDLDGTPLRVELRSGSNPYAPAPGRR